MKLRPSSMVTAPWRVARGLARPSVGAARKGARVAADLVDGLRGHAPGQADEAGGTPVAPAPRARPRSRAAPAPRSAPTAPAERRPPEPRGTPGASLRPAPAAPPRQAPDAPFPSTPSSAPTPAPAAAGPASAVTDASGEPVHVSENPVVVAEVAEAGAENGAGADLRVAEPWEGYGSMNGEQVIARIAEAGPEELAVIELYESTHRNRKTVLAAVAQRLQTTAASRRPRKRA